MITRNVPIAEVSKRLACLPEELWQDKNLTVIRVMRDGEPVLAVMTWELLAAILDVFAPQSILDGSALVLSEPDPPPVAQTVTLTSAAVR